jgi:hypothetical protein
MKKTLRVVIAILFILFWMMRLWIETPTEEYTDYPAEEGGCDEFVSEDTSEYKRIIQRSWTAYQYGDYCTRYGATQQAQQAAEEFRYTLQVDWDGDYIKFWNTLYANLYQHDVNKLTILQDSLRQLAMDRELSRSDFANLIVSFVQDIPYEFVMGEACKGNERKPCNSHIAYGLFSPAEFVYQLKGDCDTRTLLLYTLLENFGFDAVIMNSRQYEHSMLGINLPSTGDYLRYKGTNFYFWETTSVGWMQGVIPPDMGNLNYWTIVLD